MKKSDIVELIAEALGLDEKDVIITKSTDDGEVVLKMVNVDIDDADSYDDEEEEDEEELEEEDDKEKELNEEADDTSDLDDGKAPESV